MSHFGSGDWNAPSGLVAGQSGVNGATGVDTTTLATFTNSATAGAVTTFAVPRAGMYRIDVYLKTTAAGTGSGQVCNVQETHNDGTAQAAANVLAVPSAGLDGTTLNAYAEGSKVVKCNAGTNIVLTLLGSGTITTAATVQAFWTITAL